MSIHISAEKGAIADMIYLPGDPLRAKWIAENFLKDVVCYNNTRNMLGFTGIRPDGKRVSVQGSGMGMASLSIYVNELIDFYGVKEIIRLGSAGSLQAKIFCRDIVLVMASCSDSGMNLNRFPINTIFAPIADWDLLMKAYNIAQSLHIKVTIGNNFATDKFYDEAENWKVFAKYGVSTIEMESAELYTLAAQKGIKALSILTVSDSLVNGESLNPEERERTFSSMVRIAFKL